MRDFFISFTRPDKQWAEWIAWCIEEEGYSVIIESWDFAVGRDFVVEMHHALKNAKSIIAVLSNEYLKAPFATSEWSSAIASDPLGKLGRLIPVRIERCNPDGILSSRIYIDLVDLKADEAKSILIEGIRFDRKKPQKKPQFPVSNYLPSVSAGTRSDKIVYNLHALLDSLPTGHSTFIGRKRELSYLSKYWENRDVKVISFIAFGGVGKSVLVREWLVNNFKNIGYNTPRFIGCSFFSQGARQQVGSSEQFIYETLKNLGDSTPSRGTLGIRARRLVTLLDMEKTILILDGLEPLQFGPSHGNLFGKIRDTGINELLINVLNSSNVFVILTSRISLNEEYTKISSYKEVHLDTLTDNESIEILKSHGVKGNKLLLKNAANHLGNHPLALHLAGEFVTIYGQNNANEILDIKLSDQHTKSGRHASSVMNAYEKSFLREDSYMCLELLYIVGLFDRPAELDCVAFLNKNVVIGKFKRFSYGKGSDLIEAIQQLRAYGLLLAETESRMLDTHPLVREYFGVRFHDEDELGFTQAHYSIAKYHLAVGTKNPTNQNEMQTYLFAVSHLCKAGKFREGLEIYVKYVMKGEKHYAAIQLSMFEQLLSVLSYFIGEKTWNNFQSKGIKLENNLDGNENAYILSQAGLYLTACRGYSSKNVLPILLQSRKLYESSKLDNEDLYLQIEYGIWKYLIAAGKVLESINTAEKILAKNTTANNNKSFFSKLIGSRTIATSSFWNGDFIKGLEETKDFENMNLDKHDHNILMSKFGDNAILNLLAVRCLCLWHSGRSDDAFILQKKILSIGDKFCDDYSLTVIYFIINYLFDFASDFKSSLIYSEKAFKIATENGYQWWQITFKIRIKWCNFKTSQNIKNIEEICQIFNNWRDLGSEISLAYWASRISECYWDLGLLNEASYYINLAREIEERTLDLSWKPARLLLNAKILYADNNITAGENLIKEAIITAEKSGTKKLKEQIQSWYDGISQIDTHIN